MESVLHRLFSQCLEAPYITVENQGSFAVRKKGCHLTLFFEKSSGVTDWKNNLDFPCVPYRDMGTLWFCHRGFLKVWKSIEPYLIKTIQDSSIRRVTVVGYSHGAALAALCHEYIWFHRPDLRGHLVGFGFGCPRFYWGLLPRQALLRRWDTFFPIRNGRDIVTHLPPVFLGYRHVQKVLPVGEKNKYSPIDAHRAENYLLEL